MGHFIVIFATSIVIIQATSLFLGREANQWTFFLIRTIPSFTNTNSSGNISINDIVYHNVQNNNNNGNENLHMIPNAECHLSKKCFQEKHLLMSHEDVLRQWNPHIILLCICCIHTIMCLSRVQYKREHKASLLMSETVLAKSIHLPLGYALGASVLLISLVCIFQGLHNSDLVQYPTILTLFLLLLACGWYIYCFDSLGENLQWSFAYHQQFVCLPLVVLAYATLGVRIWTDVVNHILLLSIAINCLWLKNNIENLNSKKICSLVTIALPTVSIVLAYQQWNENDWKYVTGLLTCGSLVPLYLCTIVSTESHKNHKIYNKISLSCANAALLQFVCSLALF